MESSIVEAGFGAVPARALFIGKFLGYTTFSALTTGLALGQLGVLCSVGPLFPFLFGSWCGYTAGCMAFAGMETRRAVTYVEKYPQLMEHVLSTEYRGMCDFSEGSSVFQWLNQCDSKSQQLVRLGWAVMAAQSATPSVDEVEDARRQSIIALCQEREN